MAPRRNSKRQRINIQKDSEEDNDDHGPHQEQQEVIGAVNKKVKVLNIESLGNSEKKNSPVVIFAHGAGAPSSSDWMTRWKNMLLKALNAVDVVTFDYPYISSGKRRAPPKAEKLVDFHVDVVTKTMAEYPGHPVILAGKSMGSRISCMIGVHKDIKAEAIVCLGYPLKIKTVDGIRSVPLTSNVFASSGTWLGTNGALRDETLLQLSVPVIFVQGSKDGLCPLEKLEDVRKKMKTRSELHVIEGGDHSFKIAKKHLQSTGSTQDDAENVAIQAIAVFVSTILEER